jgi:hypothetical protein
VKPISGIHNSDMCIFAKNMHTLLTRMTSRFQIMMAALERPPIKSKCQLDCGLSEDIRLNSFRNVLSPGPCPGPPPEPTVNLRSIGPSHPLGPICGPGITALSGFCTAKLGANTPNAQISNIGILGQDFLTSKYITRSQFARTHTICLTLSYLAHAILFLKILKM